MSEQLAIWTKFNNSINASSHLTGTRGCNRITDYKPIIAADDDLTAIECWLNTFKHKPKTYRNYRKDAERLLLWSIISCNKALSDLQKEDFEKYINFLHNPLPAELWCGKHSKVNRHSLNWRPFRGPLKSSSIITNIATIRSLLSFLVKAQYLRANPLDLITTVTAKPNIPQAFSVAERILSLEEWQHFLTTIMQLPVVKKVRIRWLVALLYFSGLRVEELVIHTMGHIKCIDGYWWLFVIGKGNKAGKIPINKSLLEELQSYRAHLKLSPLPEVGENIPLISSQYSINKHLTVRRIHQIIKELGRSTAERIKNNNPISAIKFTKISPHWLRHLSASMQDRSGIAFKHIKENHRHQQESTTHQYVHAFDIERHKDMEKLTWEFSIDNH